MLTPASGIAGVSLGLLLVLGTCLLTNLSGYRKGGEICEQLRALGASLDWDRECFTMDAVSVPSLVPVGAREVFRHVQGKAGWE